MMVITLVLGWADSIYLIYHHYQVNLAEQQTASFCVINEVIDCDLVAMGFGSTLFGVPVATLGMFAYMYLLIVFVAERLMRPKLYPHMYCVIYVIEVVMVIFAAYEALVSFVIIKAVCIMCVALYVLTALMMISCKRALTPMSGEIIKTALPPFCAENLVAACDSIGVGAVYRLLIHSTHCLWHRPIPCQLFWRTGAV